MKTKNLGALNRNNKDGCDLGFEVKGNFSKEGTLTLIPEK